MDESRGRVACEQNLVLTSKKQICLQENIGVKQAFEIDCNKKCKVTERAITHWFGLLKTFIDADKDSRMKTCKGNILNYGNFGRKNGLKIVCENS